MQAEKKNKIVGLLREKIPGIYAVYLYGSYACGKEHPGSDIDVAFLSSQKIDAIERWNVQEFIAAELDCDIDLVDLTAASTILRKEIIEKGRILFNGDKFRTDSFEMTSYSMYLDLNENRKHILNDLKEKYGRDSDS